MSNEGFQLFRPVTGQLTVKLCMAMGIPDPEMVAQTYPPLGQEVVRSEMALERLARQLEVQVLYNFEARLKMANAALALLPRYRSPQK